MKHNENEKMSKSASSSESTKKASDEKESSKGCGCGCDLKKEVEGLVKDGKKPTVEERLEKKREVEAAFGRKEEEHK